MSREMKITEGTPLSEELQAELTAALWLDGRVEHAMRANPAETIADLIKKLGGADARALTLPEFEALPVPQVGSVQQDLVAGYTDYGSGCPPSWDCYETWDQSCHTTFDNCETTLFCQTLDCHSVVICPSNSC